MNQMKQKGFTLTEMIAVVLIIALLTIIILPSILNQLQSQKDNISKASMQLIYDATELYIKERQSMYPMVAGETYCISLESLVNVGKLKNPLQDLSTGKNIPLNKVVKVLVNEYEEGEYSLVDPQAVTCESTVELPEVSVNVEGKKASITLKSEVGVIGYAVTKKEEEVKEWTPVDGLKETTAEWEAKEATEAGDYTAWVKDKYGKVSSQDFTIEKSAFSTYLYKNNQYNLFSNFTTHYKGGGISFSSSESGYRMNCAIHSATPNHMGIIRTNAMIDTTGYSKLILTYQTSLNSLAVSLKISKSTSNGSNQWNSACGSCGFYENNNGAQLGSSANQNNEVYGDRYEGFNEKEQTLELDLSSRQDKYYIYIEYQGYYNYSTYFLIKSLELQY